MKQLETREASSLEFRAEDKNSRKLSAVVVPYNTPVNLGPFTEQFKQGAFTRYLASAPNVRALFEHDPQKLLASTANKTLRLIDGPDALRAEFDVVETSYGNDVLALVRAGETRGMSWGFRVSEDKQTIERKDGAILRTVLDADLPEITVTSRPAYGKNTSVSARSIDQAAIDAAAALLTVNDRPAYRERWRRLQALRVNHY